MKKRAITNLLLLFLAFSLNAGAQKKDLKYVMPSADSFQPVKKPFPYYKAFRGKKLVGICYLTTDLTNSMGYNGRLYVLVGLYPSGMLSGLKVLKHKENIKEAFGIEKQEFETQFTGKKISDPFKTGADVDNITGATVTVKNLARIVKRTSEKVYTVCFKKKLDSTAGGLEEEEEETGLNPKWGVQKISRETIKKSRLSEKEADFYRKVE